jgi:hypothetical protein
MMRAALKDEPVVSPPLISADLVVRESTGLARN